MCFSFMRKNSMVEYTCTIASGFAEKPEGCFFKKPLPLILRPAEGDHAQPLQSSAFGPN